jgi:hypothetical protein
MLIAYNVSPLSIEDFSAGNATNFEVECLGMWTVAYNATLKSSGSINAGIRDKDNTPIGGGIDYSFMYNYSSSNSCNVKYFCNCSPSSF